MSLRRPRQAPGADVHADQLRAELQALKETAIAFEVANSEAIAADAASASAASQAPTQDVANVAGNVATGAPIAETGAASVAAPAGSAEGAEPRVFQPIAFLNKGHYDNLIKSNALDESLVKRIEGMRKAATTA